MQKLLIGFIVNKKCLRKRLYSRIKMSLKHIMTDSVCKQALYVLFYGHSDKSTKQNPWYSVLNGKCDEAKSLRSN